MYLVTLINNDKETTIHSPFFSAHKLLNAEIKREINIADGFNFEILPNNPGYSSISPLKTLVKVTNSKTGNVEFDGRILMPTESMSDSGSFSKSFICESELGFLHDSTQRHGEYHDITVRDFLIEIINNHNADISDDEIDKKFEVGIVEVDSSTGTLYRYLGYESTFETIKDKLLDRLGGELRVRKENGVRYLDYLQSIGERKSTEIRLSKNLKSITKETEPSDIITRLIPLGERIASEDEETTDASEARLTIESVNNGNDYIDDKEAMAVFGVIAKSHTWNDITQPNRLLTSGRQFLNENNRAKIQHQLSALDLSVVSKDPDSFEIGNWHSVVNGVMGINEDMRIVRQTIDIINPENNTLTIGDKFLRASDYQKEVRKAQARVNELENLVEGLSTRSRVTITQLKDSRDQLTTIQQTLLDVDLDNLPQELQTISQQILALQSTLDNLDIPEYGLVTQTEDGLMSAVDKTKLDSVTQDSLITQEERDKIDLISVTEPIDLDGITQDDFIAQSERDKLSLISVVEPIDLDDLLARIELLEGGAE